MSSQVDVANRALSKIGDARITAFGDNSKQARAINSAFTIVRDAELFEHRWSFAIARAALAADPTAPTFGYEARFQLPTDCIRVLSAGDYYPGVDISNLRGATNRAYVIEGRYILANQTGPLYLRYISRIEDSTQWNAGFVMVMACALAVEIADELSASLTRKESCQKEYALHLAAAIKANAIELPPEDSADDTWVASRVIG